MTRVLGPGGFAPRATALILDWTLAFILSATLAVVSFGVPMRSGIEDELASLCISLLHYTVPAMFMIGSWRGFGTTPGKYLQGLRVVDHRTGERAALWRLVLRYIGYFLSLLPFGLGFLLVLANRERRALHDYIAGTRVIEVGETDLDLHAETNPQ